MQYSDISMTTAIELGKVLGRIAFEALVRLDDVRKWKLGENVDCVYVEESEIWDTLCSVTFKNDARRNGVTSEDYLDDWPPYLATWKSMYDTARLLKDQHLSRLAFEEGAANGRLVRTQGGAFPSDSEWRNALPGWAAGLDSYFLAGCRRGWRDD